LRRRNKRRHEAPTSDSALEFEFPRDYRQSEAPGGLTMGNGWSLERLSDDIDISWQVEFSQEPVDLRTFAALLFIAASKSPKHRFYPT
jgi:hypothetical protein